MHKKPPEFSALVIQDAKIFKAGNSLAVRIPSAIAKHCDFEDGAEVEIAAEHGILHIRRQQRSFDLGELIDGITPDNVHAEAFDDLHGAERW